MECESVWLIASRLSLNVSRGHFSFAFNSSRKTRLLRVGEVSNASRYTYLPDWVVGMDIKTGLLQQIFPEWSEQPEACTGIHALRALRNPPARVSVFMDYLRASIGQPPVWS